MLPVLSGCSSISIDRVSDEEMRRAVPMRIQDGQTLFFLSGRGWFFEDGVILTPDQLADPRDESSALYRCESAIQLCG
jgi:hypothetical protein